MRSPVDAAKQMIGLFVILEVRVASARQQLHLEFRDKCVVSKIVRRVRKAIAVHLGRKYVKLYTKVF